MITQQDIINNDYQRSLEMRSPFVMLRPKIFPDGDMWCALYGDNLQEGVAAFGKTPELAEVAFNRAWINQPATLISQDPRDTIARARYGQACDGGYEIVGTAAASAILQDLTAAGYRIVGPADMEKAVEAACTEHWTGWGEWSEFRKDKEREVMRAALTAAAPHMPVPAGWQTMETAPKNRHVLVVSKRFPEPHEAMLYDDGWHTWGVNGAFRDDPTIWMPLPAAPKPAALTQEPKP